VDRPETRYARSGDLAIAYQVHGAGEHDLLFNSGTASNIETVWQLPEAVRLFERLGRFARVIRYDRRDAGLSDPIRDDLTPEAHADDVLAVIDAVGAQRPVLVGSVDGARSLALFAATRPDRVGGFIALAPTVRGGAADAPELAETAIRAITEFEDYPGPVVSLYAPSWASDPVRSERLTRYFQTASTPGQAARLLHLALTSDISHALPLVQAPTLVLHPRDLAFVSREAVREFVDLIPGAQFREIPGDAGIAFALDVDLIADIIEEFVTGTAPAPPTSRILATVLFTDLVSSTERAARVGDRAWAGTLDRHLAQTRAAVSAHGGETIKTTGDGVLALFTGPAQGVRCAARVIADARDLDLEVRAGLHTGEVERTSDDVAGLAVHLAARIMSLADAGETLVSRTVCDLVIGSELTFTDRGEHELKGVPSRWALYAAG
jgi:class 3 adenylate cyclase